MMAPEGTFPVDLAVKVPSTKLFTNTNDARKVTERK